MVKSKNLFIWLYVFGVSWTAQAKDPQTTDFARMPVPHRLLLLAPHPDDVILAAGLIMKVKAAGGSVRVVDMTCGDGSTPFGVAYVKRQGFNKHPQKNVNYGMYRQFEDAQAVKSIGMDPASELVFLGYPDSGLWDIYQGGLSAVVSGTRQIPFKSKITGLNSVPYSDAVSPDAPFIMDSVVDDVAKEIHEFLPDLIVLTHPNDNHPDHAATYWFAHLAIKKLNQLGLPLYAAIDLYATQLPLKLQPDFQFRPTRGFPSATEWFDLEHSNEEHQLKINLIGKYPSQMAGEHPFEKNYHGFKSFMYGYVGTNEMYGIVKNPKNDDAFRERLNADIMKERIFATIGNVFSDIGSHFLGDL